MREIPGGSGETCLEAIFSEKDEVTSVTLGIVVNTDKHPEHVAGIARAALKRGHTVMVFMTDDGVRICTNPDIVALKGEADVSLCDHSAKDRGVEESTVPEGITCGSQYNNAVVNHDADRVVVI